MTNVHLLWISERELAQISYRNPGMAFYFLRLTTNRLIANASRVETVEATLLAPS
jgi:hypothetical protein